jgi:hypothetical protein
MFGAKALNLDCDAIVSKPMPMMPDYVSPKKSTNDSSFVDHLNIISLERTIITSAKTVIEFVPVVVKPAVTPVVKETCRVCQWQNSLFRTACFCDELIELGVCIDCMNFTCTCKKVHEHSDHCLCHLEFQVGQVCVEDL